MTDGENKFSGLSWTPTAVPKIGDKVAMHVPPPLTWWDRFLWRWFRIERKREAVLREFVVTHTAASRDTPCP